MRRLHAVAHFECVELHYNFTGVRAARGYHREVRIAVGVMFLGVASARLAHADQCEWLDDKRVAARAANELERAKRFVTLCEPCGDKAPSAPQTVTTVTTRKVDDTTIGNFDEVLVNGETIDLAYTYVDVGDHYQNLAKLAGCPASGVSPSVTIDGAPAGAAPEAPVAAPIQRPIEMVSWLPPPAYVTIDQDARTRWEASIGASVGTIALDHQTLDVAGLALTAGVRTHRFAVFADYRRLAISWDPGTAAREDSLQPASRGTLQRFGVGARYNAITLGARDHDAPTHDLVELFAEADVGAQRIAWDGVMWRRDVALGGGARIGFRVSDTRTVGLLVRVLDLYDGGLLASLSLAITN